MDRWMERERKMRSWEGRKNRLTRNKGKSKGTKYGESFINFFIERER